MIARHSCRNSLRRRGHVGIVDRHVGQLAGSAPIEAEQRDGDSALLQEQRRVGFIRITASAEIGDPRRLEPSQRFLLSSALLADEVAEPVRGLDHDHHKNFREIL